MFTEVPCATDGCEGAVSHGRNVCRICFDRIGYGEGYSRKRDEAWLAGRTISEIRLIPIEGPGCSNHPVTPRPDFCLDCKRATLSETRRAVFAPATTNTKAGN